MGQRVVGSNISAGKENYSPRNLRLILYPWNLRPIKSSIFLIRLPKFELKDEDGTVLGGKRASIQFAHDMKAKANPETPKPVDDVEPKVSNFMEKPIYSLFLLYFQLF